MDSTLIYYLVYDYSRLVDGSMSENQVATIVEQQLALFNNRIDKPDNLPDITNEEFNDVKETVTFVLMNYLNGTLPYYFDQKIRNQYNGEPQYEFPLVVDGVTVTNNYEPISAPPPNPEPTPEPEPEPTPEPTPTPGQVPGNYYY